MRAKRLAFLAAATTALGLLAAAGTRVILERYCRQPPGGIGTRLLAAEQPPADVYLMPGDPADAAKPLSDLLPSRWTRLKRTLVAEKSKRILSVYVGPKRVKSYFMSLGHHPVGPKDRRNDFKTPEGAYYVCQRNPRSAYELSILISYPGAREARNGVKNRLIDKKTRNRILRTLARGRTPPQYTALGGNICIHGGGIGEVAEDLSMARIEDWTWGCIALRSEDIREVFDFARPGTRVVIRP